MGITNTSKAFQLNLLLKKICGDVIQNQTEPLRKNGWIRPGAGVKKNDSPDF